MIVQTPLLGFLGLAGKSQATPQDGDTKLVVPGLVSLGFEPQFPAPNHFSAAQSGLAPIYGWILSISETIAAANTVELIQLGPGLWDVSLNLYIQPAGAVEDVTATLAINYAENEQTGATVLLARVANTKAVPQNITWRQRTLVTAKGTFSFFRTKTAGAGTGTNLANYVITASRLF